MTAFCTLCGNMEPGDLGATIGICLNADACHRRQARMREHRQYVAEQIAREIEDIICTSEAACGDLDCRQALADAATARHIGGVREAAPPVAAALEDADALPGMPSPSPVPAVTPTAVTEPAKGADGLAEMRAATAAVHVPGPRRMIGRQLTRRDCLGCGRPWPCEHSWQARAEVAEAKLADIAGHAPAIVDALRHALAYVEHVPGPSAQAAAERYRSALAITGSAEEARDGC